MLHHVELLSSIVIMGLAAGFSPGPTSTLVITQTAQYGLKDGIKVAIAPLLTDLPIIAIILGVFSYFALSSVFLGSVSLLGGIFLVYLSCDLLFAPKTVLVTRSSSRSITKGILTNLLNPGPYLFWGTIGAPMLMSTFKTSTSVGICSVALFLISITAAKFSIALISNYSMKFIKGNHYHIFVRSLGIVMAIFAIVYFKEGIVQVGLW